MHSKNDYMKLIQDFQNCSVAITALGDENRLHMLYEMMIEANPRGIRVGEIVNKSNLSRQAVYNHLKILREAKIVNVRREGTKNYYYIDPDMKMLKDLIYVLQRTVKYVEELPFRGEE